MRTRKLIIRGGPLAVFAAVIGLGAMPAASQAAKIPGCTPSSNIEAIIDDSGSMASEDPGKFRTKLLDVFANLQQNNGKILGAIEFGSSPKVLFAPGTIPGVIPAMQASFLQVNADDGGTDYEKAFASATAVNGNATSRIFLTDGSPNAYPSSHLSPKVKTYVVGIGDFAATTSGSSVLSQIAAETGGPAPFLIQDASQVQPVAAAITAAVNCQAPPLTFIKTFNRQGQSVKYGFKPASKTADILISWGSEFASLDAIQITQAGGKKKRGKKSVSLATLAKKGKKGKGNVKVVKKRGTTFVTLKLKKLKKGKQVKFKVKAQRLSGPTVVTTQVIR